MIIPTHFLIFRLVKLISQCTNSCSMKKLVLSSWILVVLCGFAEEVWAQKRNQATPAPTTTKTTAKVVDENLYNSLEWRSIGPFRGGRSAAATGVPGKPNLYYFGATGGGVWRTQDGGQNWENISDGYFGGSIGAVAVSEYDPNVIYVGGGEKTVRGNMSYGYGMWKSVDAGKTWKAIGLEKSRHIPRIRIHPRDPNLVYAAVLGNVFAPSAERGVYRSKDGGDTWEKVLFVNDTVGAVDLLLDPNNPRIIYASTWNVQRKPYLLSSGGAGSGLWKTTDGGDNWENISRNEGLPKDTIGIIGIAVSPVNSNRVWALVESETGGLFRSEDAGKTWRKINESRDLRQRAWYYTRIYADTKDEDVVYVLNVDFLKSKDGGKSFEAINTPHSDHHDLWIAPEDPSRMIIADDGGVQVTFDGGANWSTYYNQPTAQYYRVVTDNHFPYRIYVAQQDNTTLRVKHRTTGFAIGEQDWEVTAGCECGHIAVDPTNDEIVYGGCYDGIIERMDHRVDLTRNVNVWPDNPMGHGVGDWKYRFQWNFPIMFSKHDPKKLYTGSNHLHLSTDEGQTWQVISPDLTRNDSTKMGSSGGPITQDNTSVEYYCTIFAIAESPRKEGLIWVGSDDGLVHLTRDGGNSWENVTPTNMPKWIMINSIEPDPFQDGGAYIAATLYKGGDFKPYLYKTTDYGKTWTKIVNGINEEHFTRVVRADPERQGLLYAGTETGMYISFDDGANWQPFQLNLPIVPITDLTIRNNNLIAATQGRSLWMIDDLTVLHQLSDAIAQKEVHLYKPMPTYRMDGGQNKNVKNAGINHPSGVMVHFYLKEKPIDSVAVVLSFHEKDGTLIREFSTKAKEKSNQLEVKAGGNLFVWNMRYPEAKRFDGMILWWSSLSGPKAVPGEYLAKLKVGDKEETVTFEILQDPRSQVSLAAIQEQFDFVKSVGEKVTEAHDAIIDIRDIRKQMNTYTERLKGEEEMNDLLDLSKEIDKKITAIEETLYQTKNRSGQDPLNFPIRLTNKLAHLNALISGDYAPTQSMYGVKQELATAIDAELAKLRQVIQDDLPKFNQLVREKSIDAIQLKEDSTVN